MIVNPAPGALVRDPASSRAIVPGEDIDPLNPYWARLLADGDIVPASAPKEPKA